MKGATERLLPGGEGTVRAQDAVYLVPNTVPGDVIRFIAGQKRRGSRRGQLAEIIQASACRGKPRCSVAASCGGCALQYLKPEHHAEIKNCWIDDAFRKFMEADTTCQWIGHTEADRHRRRVRWHVGMDEAGLFLGFRARSSHDVVRQKHCPVLSDALQIIHDTLETVLNPSIEAVLATQLSDGIHVVLETPGKDTLRFDPPCSHVGGLDVQWWQQSASVIRPLARPVKDLHEALPAGEEMIRIRIGPDDFVQGQYEANQALVRQVTAWSSGARRIADLFSGVGNLSLPLAHALKVEVSGAEIRGASVQRANANARTLNVHASYMQADLFGDFDTAPFAGADVLILDPPRKGARRVCETMPKLLPAKIIMISCNVAAGARDAAILHTHGYRLRALRALDMFPWAGHVETMTLWTQ